MVSYVCVACGEEVADEDERVEHALKDHDPIESLFRVVLDD